MLGSAKPREEASCVMNKAHMPLITTRGLLLSPSPQPPASSLSEAKTEPSFWSSVFRSSHFTLERHGCHPPCFPPRILKI